MNVELTEAQRELVRAQQADTVRQWMEQRAWDLCDDIAGRGCTDLAKLSDTEIAAYARGVRNTLGDLLERFECKELRLQTLVHGALGERHQRRYGTGGHHRAGYERRRFGNLAIEIRMHRIAMLDDAVTFNYPLWESWRKRVWAIERQGVAREEWEEFERLQHELNALMSLSHWLVGGESWRQKNWAWRKSQEVKEAA